MVKLWQLPFIWYRRAFGRYHPMTPTQVIDANRRYWDAYYRQWRERPIDDRMTLFPPGQRAPD